MTAHALYTQTLSEYKSRLISSPCLTLRSYCHECHVNYHGMELRLSRIISNKYKYGNTLSAAVFPLFLFSCLL